MAKYRLEFGDDDLIEAIKGYALMLMPASRYKFQQINISRDVVEPDRPGESRRAVIKVSVDFTDVPISTRD